MDPWPTAEVYPHVPPMAGGYPVPVVLYAGPSLWVAYRVGPADGDGLFAVVHFTGVVEHRLGPPGDERLGEHALYGRGLEAHAFHQVIEALTDAYAPRRWVVTFRDETLEVLASFVEVASRGVAAASGWDALRAVVPAAV
jgi:hypothetical protein